MTVVTIHSNIQITYFDRHAFISVRFLTVSIDFTDRPATTSIERAPRATARAPRWGLVSVPRVCVYPRPSRAFFPQRVASGHFTFSSHDSRISPHRGHGDVATTRSRRRPRAVRRLSSVSRKICPRGRARVVISRRSFARTLAHGHRRRRFVVRIATRARRVAHVARSQESTAICSGD